MKKALKVLTISGVSLLVLLFVLLNLSFQLIEDKGNKEFRELESKGLMPINFKLNLSDKEIVNTVTVGDTRNSKILFIHGSPGDWTAWQNLMSDSFLNENYCMIAYDRPGYGETTIEREKNLEKQAEIAYAVMQQFGPNEKFTIIGHSYGGGVAAQLMVSYPEKIKKAVMVAGAISYGHQKPRWYNKVARRKIVNWMLPNDLKSSNKEMLGLYEGLKNIHPKLEKLDSINQLIIHGEKDVLVPYETVAYWKSLGWDNAEYLLSEDWNHFLPFTKPEVIVKAIEDFD